jgi:hypothetical protein
MCVAFFAYLAQYDVVATSLSSLLQVRAALPQVPVVDWNTLQSCLVTVDASASMTGDLLQQL